MSTAAIAQRQAGPIPIASPGFHFWAPLIFPGLITASVIGNQQWTLGPFVIGQMISWIVNIAAVFMLLALMRNKSIVCALTILIVLSRAAGSGYRGAGLVDLAYLTLLNSLFLLVGATMAVRAPRMIRSQVRWICFFSFVFMVMQVTGVGEWTQFLALENYGIPKTAVPTLFVPEREMVWQMIQARPSGLFYSNNFLSLIVLYAIALNLSDQQRRKLNRWDVMFLTMAVLSMSKIVFLGTALLMVWLLMFGLGGQRARMVRAAALVVGLFALYRWLFPGLFDHQVNLTHFGYSLFVRVNDFVARLDQQSALVQFITPYLFETPQATWDTGAGLSGYTHIQRWLPFAGAAALVVLPFYLKGLRRFRAAYPPLASMPVLVGIVAVVLPAAVPIWAAPLYWFMAGFAALPLLVLVVPSIFPRPRTLSPAHPRVDRGVGANA